MACGGLQGCEVGVPKSVLAIEKTKRTIDLAFAMLKYAH